MTTGAALARLSEPKLRAWILARMRGQQQDPPVDESRLESPDDYVRVIHQETRDAKFRVRLEKAALAALREAAEGRLQAGPDARAVRHLSALLDGVKLRGAVPALQKVAELGAFGGNLDGLDPDTEQMVLAALAGLQSPDTLWGKWEALWQREVLRLWPVVTVGLRLSNPQRALEILPEVVRRAAGHPGFPLGDVLWAFATDERYTASEFANALDGLTGAEFERCRQVLRELGAKETELDNWVPSRAAGQELYDRHSDFVLRFFMRLVHDVSEVQGLVKATFMAYQKAVKSFEGDHEVVRGHILAVALKKFREFLRRRHKGNRLIDAHANAEQVAEVTAEKLGLGDPSELVEQNEENKLLLKALRRIPVDDQLLFLMSFWEGLTNPQIAEILDLPVGTVASRLRLGKRHLEAQLKELTENSALVGATRATFHSMVEQHEARAADRVAARPRRSLAPRPRRRRSGSGR